MRTKGSRRQSPSSSTRHGSAAAYTSCVMPRPISAKVSARCWQHYCGQYLLRTTAKIESYGYVVALTFFGSAYVLVADHGPWRLSLSGVGGDVDDVSC
ncbi:Transposase, mutator type [Pseudomonas amygdali pv. dendropanacis]|uniref:Transposase, mutator type n=1 Tax=Pseudomonas amygdali pv. dendropanacis TaxID=235272 RepID=A0A0P9P6L3_PSEA0|nr:Transposase, mutator type [Pseudomonas amygdali pv. dendropanacis]